MKYLKNTTEFYIEEPTVLSLGKFDGIHRGHELLMEHLASKKEAGLAAVIFTFNIPPRKSVEQVEAKVLSRLGSTIWSSVRLQERSCAWNRKISLPRSCISFM